MWYWGHTYSSKAPDPESGVSDSKAHIPAAHFSKFFQVPCTLSQANRNCMATLRSAPFFRGSWKLWSGTRLTVFWRYSTLRDLAPECHRNTVKRVYRGDSAGNFSKPKIRTNYMLYHETWPWTFLSQLFFLIGYLPNFSFWHFNIQSILLEKGLGP